MSHSRRCRPIVGLLTAVAWDCLAGIVGTAGDAVAPRVRLSPLLSREDTCTWGAHNGHAFSTRSCTLTTGKTTFGLLWTACTDKAHGERTSWSEGYLGMPAPNSCNWYHSGFLFVRLNGEDVGSYRPTYFGPVESGARGAVDARWVLPVGELRLRFVALPDDEALLTEVRLEPAKPVATFSLELRCYPGAFTAWNKIKGDRTVSSACREEHQNAWSTDGTTPPEARTVTVDPAAERWLFYADGVCDVARGMGAGPCAVLFLPDQIRSGSVTLTDYPVTTTLDVRPETRSLRLAFWDFGGRTNAAGLQYMKANADRCRRLLEGFDFTSATVREMLAGTRRPDIAALAKAQGSPAEVTGPATEFMRRLDAALERARSAQDAGGALPLRDEDAILALLREAETVAEPLRWKLLFAD